MADTTTVLGLPFPEGSDANDVPADMQALAERLDDAPGIESLTSAQIAALSAGQKPAGRVVYNSTTSKLQVSNGSTFANIDAAALLLAGGTMAGNIAMGSNKVTGLAAATTNGDAVRYEQALLLAGGTMAGNINANGNKVTGLAAATTNGDAVRYEQLVATDAAVYAQGTTTTLTSGTLAKVTYTSEVDPSNMLSSGTFTLPTAGVWMVSSRATTSAAVLYSIEIRHSGTTIGGNTVGGNEEVESAQLVVASASDTIEVWVSGNGGTTAVRTVVARIGTT